MKTITSILEKDGTFIDFTDKPKWVEQVEARGVAVEPMVWAKVTNKGPQPCRQVSWMEKRGEYYASWTQTGG
jgi:hypothetical protein